MRKKINVNELHKNYVEDCRLCLMDVMTNDGRCYSKHKKCYKSYRT